MAVLHLVDRPHHLVVTTFSGQVTVDEIAAACTKLRHDHDFRPSYRQLADLSKVSRLELQPEQLTSIRLTYDPFAQESRRAFVATDENTFGVVTTYKSIVESEQFAVFPSLLDAISWLDLEVTVLHAVCLRDRYRSKSTEAEKGLTFDLPVSTPPTFRAMHRSSKKRHGTGH
jgi:hypothetical protein